MEEEKLGKMVVDGKLIDLDNIPIEDMQKIIEELEEKEKRIVKKLDEKLKVGE